MKKSYLILAAAAVGALFASCDDFLDDNRMPMTSIVDDPAYWSTSANVQLQLDRMLSGSPLYSGYSGWYYFKYLNDDQVGASFENWPYPTLPADVGEYVTQHEHGYEAGEYLRDFLDYHKLGEYITQEREGEFMYGSFVCMEEGCDVMKILHEKRNEIELGGM